MYIPWPMQSRSDVTLIKIMNQNIWLLFLNLLFTIHLSHLILIWCTSSQKTCHKKNNRLAVKDQQTNNNHSRVSCRLSDLGLYSREEIFKILFCLWHRLCVVLQKLKKNALNQEYMLSQLVKNDWKHWSPENVSISIPAAGQQLIQIGCKGWRRDLHRSCWRAGEDWRPGNCFVPKQKSDGLSSLPASLFINAPPLISRRNGEESQGQGEGTGVKIPPLWRTNRTETSQSEPKARNSETEPELNQWRACVAN